MDVFTAFGLSASAGLNAYIPLLVVAILARFTKLIELSSPWDNLTSYWVIGVLVVLSVMEFAVDKIPAVNHINDIIQTLIRPTAGAIVFVASVQGTGTINSTLAMITGLLVAGTVHGIKSVAVRPAVTTTTGGAGNIPVSILEDVISTLMSILAIVVPILIAAIVILVTSWFVWWLWKRTNREKIA